MRIGQLAERSGVSAKTIRYYEQTGLLPLASRQFNGYRSYSHRDVEVLRFIHRARTLGFSVATVADLLELWESRGRTSAEVKALATRHVADVEARIAQLEGIRDTLLDLVQRCHGDDRPDCPIIDNLAGEPGCSG